MKQEHQDTLNGIDSDTTKRWWLRFDQDDLIYAEELIDFVMYHKVQGSSEYTVDEKYEILTAWETVQDVLWEKDDD
jgi:hypothetical protein